MESIANPKESSKNALGSLEESGTMVLIHVGRNGVDRVSGLHWLGGVAVVCVRMGVMG